MEVFTRPLGEIIDFEFPASFVVAFVWNGEVTIVRRTHPEEEPDSFLEREAARMSREHKAARRLDKNRQTRDNLGR
jgi:hypothetical protein